MGGSDSLSAEINPDEFEHLVRTEHTQVSPSILKSVVEPAPRPEVGAAGPEFDALSDDQGDSLSGFEEPPHVDLDGFHNLGNPVPEELGFKD